jgi:hypothetical protein
MLVRQQIRLDEQSDTHNNVQLSKWWQHQRLNRQLGDDIGPRGPNLH